MVLIMTETRYYKDKIYIPREIRERLNLSEGDIIQFKITEDGEIRLVVLKANEARNRLLECLDNPPNLGSIFGSLRRTEIYEDLA